MILNNWGTTDLYTWEEIARYLGVSVRSAQLWRSRYNLPVHRQRSSYGYAESVVAYRDELDAWVQTRRNGNGSPENVFHAHIVEGWKGIASYCGVAIRTVQLWERTKGFPVHRFPGVKGRVFADTDELERWRHRENPEAQAPVQI